MARHIYDDLPVAQQDNAIREIQRFIKVVGHEKNRSLHTRQEFPKHVLHLRSSKWIERAERLVHQQNSWLRRKGPRQPDSLTLATRKLMRVAPSERRRIQANELEQLTRAACALSHRMALCLENNSNIALHGEVRKQPRLLNDVTHPPAQRDDVSLRGSRHKHLAAGGLDYAIDSAEQSCLPRSASADNGGDGALFNGHRNALQQRPPASGHNGNVSKLKGSTHRTDCWAAYHGSRITASEPNSSNLT